MLPSLATKRAADSCARILVVADLVELLDLAAAASLRHAALHAGRVIRLTVRIVYTAQFL